MSNTIGKKTTFWELVKNKIKIPTLQRDYIYGSGTEKTETVLSNMLRTFKNALVNDTEETLDFVYGSKSKAREFMPLDGQQRLTTLFLLHYYAGLKNKELQDDGFTALGHFSYATRNCTIAFCNNLLIKKHDELRSVIFSAKNGDKHPIRDYLMDLDEFRNSFYTDPSVMSMITVLDRIHQNFNDIDGLWQKLTSDNCPINFYLLDFGVFDLSDDLYNKMNSRGKPLTEFEVFKAKIHKRIAMHDKNLANRIAIKLDTDWMQFIWGILNHTNNLKEVDPAYMCFFKNLFRTLDYVSGYTPHRFDSLNDDCIEANMGSKMKINAVEHIFDTFTNLHNCIPDELNEDYSRIMTEAISSDIKYTNMLYLYAFYIGLALSSRKPEYIPLTKYEFYLRFRHVRNLINNSSDFIREDNMPRLLDDIRHVMCDRLLKMNPLILNRNSWNEEQEKELHRDVWQKLFIYEDTYELNGTIQAFAYGLSPDNRLNLGNPDFVAGLTARLKKAVHFFKSTDNMQEYERRSILLAIGDYAMCSSGKSSYRYFGIIKSSWQNFTGFHRFNEKNRIMETFDKIDVKCNLSRYLYDTSDTNTENWRYYAIKYAKEITVAYRSSNYGYIYFPGVDDLNLFGNNPGYLDAVVLQSSYYSPTNVAWKMIHRILEQKLSDKYSFYLNNHGGSEFILSKIGNDAKLDMSHDGWHVIGISPDILKSIGLDVTAIQGTDASESGESEDTSKCDSLVRHHIGHDYVDEGIRIFELLDKEFGLLKKQ